MRDRTVVVEPFELLDLLECTVHKKVNEHATVSFSGHIPENKEDEYVEMNLLETWGRVVVYDEDGVEKLIFLGAVKSG